MPLFQMFSIPQPDVAVVPRVWVNGVQKTSVKEFYGSAQTTSGVATFYLTMDGTPTGQTIFTNVFKESFQPFVEDASNAYQFSNYTLSGDKKSLSITVTKIGTNAASALLNLLGGTLSVLTGITFGTNATNGTTIYIQVKGD